MATVVITGKDYEGSLKEVQVSEHAPHGLLILDAHHELLHKGEKYRVEIEATTIASGADRYLLAIFPEKEIHVESMEFELVSAGSSIDAKIEIYVGSTCSTSVGNETPVNLNVSKIGIKDSTVLFNNNAAIPSDLGTKLPFTTEFQTENKTLMSGEEYHHEMLSETAGKSIIKIHNNDTSAVKVYVWITYYETTELS